MQIVRLENSVKKTGIFLRAKVGNSEFQQLQGNLNNICMFAVDTVTEPVKVTKTGARHSYAKWLLLPKTLRSHFKSNEYDYDSVNAGFIEYKDNVFFVFMVERKQLG